MENKDTTTSLVIVISIIMLLTIIVLNKPHDTIPPQINNVNKEDSLINVISNLESELIKETEGWDSKERRYEEIIFEYEYGLSHLKETHSEAYREFHRIIGYRERYSRELEKDNKKRLNIENGNTLDVRR